MSAGFSGPAILDVSHLVVQHLEGLPNSHPVQLHVNWTGNDKQFWKEYFVSNRNDKSLVANKLKGFVPERLATALCSESNISDKLMCNMTVEERNKLMEILTNYDLDITGHGGYKLAEVTGTYNIMFKRLDLYC